MKAISAKITKGLTRKTKCVCADNSGAKIVMLISAFRHKTRYKQSMAAGIGDVVNVVVKKGKPDIRSKIERAVIVRQRKEFRRFDGRRVKFEDNAVVLIDDKGLPKASEVKGVIAKEVGERFPKIVGISSGLI